MEAFILDAEKEVKKADPDLSIELRQPIDWIKYHTRTMVRIIDTKCDEEFAERFWRHLRQTGDTRGGVF